MCSIAFSQLLLPSLSFLHLLQPSLLLIPCLSATCPLLYVMSPTHISTIDELIEILEAERKAFGNEYLALSEKQRASLEKFSQLVNLNNDDVHHNAPKKRAQTIMNDLWRHIPEVFILRALPMTFARLGSLKSNDYLRPILDWWQRLEHPTGLKATLQQCPDILPTKRSDAECVPSSEGRRATYKLQTNRTDLYLARTARSHVTSTQFVVTELEPQCLLHFLQ